MHLTKQDIITTPRVKRINLLNAITGIKSANLIGTVSSKKITNLAIFSSVVHLSSSPALIGFFVRPVHHSVRHTDQNIQAIPYYTINQVVKEYVAQAHYTSAKFPKEVSEFKSCGFTEEFIEDFPAPFVKESSIKIGLSLVEQIKISANQTKLIVGQIEKIIIPQHLMNEEGYIKLEEAKSVGVSGCNSYYNLRNLMEMPHMDAKQTQKILD